MATKKKKTAAKKSAATKPKVKAKAKAKAKTKAKATTKVKATKTKAKAKATAKPKRKDEGLLPTPEEEARFWELIEDAWAAQGKEVNKARLAMSKRKPDDDEDEDASLVDDALDGFIESLSAVFSFEDFPREELVAMDRVLERKLYDIDRHDVHEVLDGSDDGFLYARGYVVALGKAYYDAVSARPELGTDAECEEMCYLPASIHNDRFGDYPDTGSKISRESCSNSAAWPKDA